LLIIHESEVEKEGRVSKWLLGPWNSSINEVEFGVAELKSGEEIKAHYHKEVQEFIYLINGELKVNINGETRLIQKGTVVYFEPNETHTWLVLSETAKLVVVKTPSRPKDKFFV